MTGKHAPACDHRYRYTWGKLVCTRCGDGLPSWLRDRWRRKGGRYRAGSV